MHPNVKFFHFVRLNDDATFCWDSSQVSLTPPAVPHVISLSVISPKFAVSQQLSVLGSIVPTSLCPPFHIYTVGMT